MIAGFAQRLPVTTRPRLRRAARAAGWYVALPMLRLRARQRIDALRAGAVTIVTVNWNSWSYLEVQIEVVRRRSPAGTEILVIDNGSVDGSRARLAARPDVTAVMLPANVGHDLALDIGVLLCQTEYVIALDVDAFPLHDGWLTQLLAPLYADAEVSGARLNREYVHPCCWAMRTARFVSHGHSFRSRYCGRQPGRDASGDVGEEISRREAPRLHFVEVSTQIGPGDVGTVFGELVYHNFYATRFRATTQPLLDKSVAAADAERAWAQALECYVR